MEINQIVTKSDIARIEQILDKLSEQLSKISSAQSKDLPRFLTGRQVMELLNIKEDALRTMRMNGSVKYKTFGKLRRYPTNQFFNQ